MSVLSSTDDGRGERTISYSSRRRAGQHLLATVTRQLQAVECGQRSIIKFRQLSVSSIGEIVPIKAFFRTDLDPSLMLP